MVKYRPHRELLADAMREARLFATVEEMYEWIASEGWCSPEDLSISENRGKDSRIDWEETRYVCTKRMGTEVYDVPQCIGMCSIESGENWYVGKGDVVKIIENEDFLVEYDKSKGMYRVSVFDDYHYLDEICFEEYIKEES